MGFHLTQVVVYLEVFSHTENPFLNFFLGVHLPFIGWGSYLSELSLEVVIIPLFLYARRKGIITRNTVIISFWRFRGVFFFSFFLWVVDPFMIELFLKLVG